MAIVQTIDWRAIVVRGLIAGVIGGILIDAFLYVAQVMPAHGTILGLWQFVASTALGPSAFTNPSTAWIGLFMHACTSIAWGIAFSYVAHTRPGVAEHPYISGVVYGIVVMIIMQIVLMVAKSWPTPTVQNTLIGLIAHGIFFGLPVSLYVSRAMRS
jgi:hypothetical protein